MKILKDKRAQTVIVCGLILISAAFVLLRYEGFFAGVSSFLNIFRPFIIGAAIAFVLNRPLKKISALYEKRYEKSYAKKVERIKKKKGADAPLPRKSRMPYKLSVLTIYIITLLLLALIIVIIVPQLAKSITLLVENFDNYYNNLSELFTKWSSEIGMDMEWLEELDIMDKIYGLFEYIPDVLFKTLDITTNIVSVIVDLSIGIVFSIYVLLDKKSLTRQANLLLKRFVKKKQSDKIVYLAGLSSKAMSNYVAGQLTEALIMGMLCFIGMTIIGFDYAILISTIIGLTVLIPIVGPIIGTVPSALILLLVEPMDAVWFVVFIILLQQFETNLIYPKVVGDSMGLPAIWVLFAVIVGGGLYGILGMILGIPLMSVIYIILKNKVNELPPEERAAVVTAADNGNDNNETSSET